MLTDSVVRLEEVGAVVAVEVPQVGATPDAKPLLMESGRLRTFDATRAERAWRRCEQRIEPAFCGVAQRNVR